jgi:hypothetical protein
MRGVWIRRLIPASVVSLVLAFSYFSPAFGLNVAPVKSHDNPNCGRFGYGYHGGKHNFTCPTSPPPVLTPAVVQAAPAVKSQAPAPPSGSSLTTSGAGGLSTNPLPSVNSTSNAPAAAGAAQWRAFTVLILRELS